MSIVIYNALGQEVATLMDNQEQSAGKHSMNWGGKDAHGNSISTGVYFYQLRTSDTQITKKMVLVK
jgi:flagellar hook assembly protein FlgD